MFENKVACLLGVDLLCTRFTQLGGRIVSVQTQTGPAGFDDLEIALEHIDGSDSIVHAQCRHRQQLTGSSAKFKTLLSDAWSAVSSDRAGFASGRRRLALIVDEASPGHRSMVDLCHLAKESATAIDFESTVGRHGGEVAKRLGHCRTASELSMAELHSLLAAFDVVALALDDPASRDAVELVNRLQTLWHRPDHRKVLDLANALFRHITDLGPRAGAFDLASLQTHLGGALPRTIGAGTRRAKLSRLRAAGEARATQSLRLLGLDDPIAAAVAVGALDEPPLALTDDLAVIVGAIGVGKTTELERQHRRAIDSALEDPSQPIPVFIHARELSAAGLGSLIEAATNGLGDPTKVGVHLAIDALDEAGIGIDDAVRLVAGARAVWPNTRVVLATRPQSSSPGIQPIAMQPLTVEAASRLMTTIHPDSTRWLPSRVELTELLRRPMFAITYALDRMAGDLAATRPANLVASVGKRAIRDLDPADQGGFQLLVALACAIVDSGGQTIELAALGASPFDLERVARNRIVEIVDGRATFQLAALTEWFAATAILGDPARLERCVRTPLAARRWRYALVQAIRQGTDEDADRIMTMMLAKVPATAAWVYEEAVEPFSQQRKDPLPGSDIEAGERIRNAAARWLDPWPSVRAMFVRDGETPVLGISVDSNPIGSGKPRIITAWGGTPASDNPVVVPLPAHLHPLADRDAGWTGAKAGRPVDGPLWPWNWTRHQLQRVIDDLLEGRDLIRGVRTCWTELAWDYAHRMLHKSPDVQSVPIARETLEKRIEEIVDTSRAGPNHREVFVGGGRYGWRLSEGRSFVEDLHRLSIDKVESPWPAANSSGSWISDWWTTEQLHDRLHLATKAALDAYRELVEVTVPTMAAELATYQLLPARIVGEVTQGDPMLGIDGAPRFSWYIEPLEAGSDNEAVWTIVDEPRGFSHPSWDEAAELIHRRRGELAAFGLTIHHGEPDIYSSTPAGSLALRLLADDLASVKWTTRSGRVDSNAGSARPTSR
jgi:hypothetical protein